MLDLSENGSKHCIFDLVKYGVNGKTVTCLPLGSDFDKEEYGQKDSRKWHKKLGWRRRDRHCVTGARRQEFEAAGQCMVLNSTGRNRFTTASRVRIDSGWSWIFRIARLTLHNCKMAPLTSQTLAHAIFFCCRFDRLPVRISTSDLHHQILLTKIYQIRSKLMVLECSFLFFFFFIVRDSWAAWDT